MSRTAKSWISQDKRSTEDLDPKSAPKNGECIADLNAASKAKRDGKK